MLREGDIVIMSSLGCDYYSDTDSNPHNMEGTILEYNIGYDEDDYAIRVLWNNQVSNSYRLIDLRLTNPTDWKQIKDTYLFYHPEFKKVLNFNGKVMEQEVDIEKLVDANLFIMNRFKKSFNKQSAKIVRLMGRELIFDDEKIYLW